MGDRFPPKVRCELCFERFGSLYGHLRKHGYTVTRYKVEFDAPVISPLTLHKLKLAAWRRTLAKTGSVPKKRLQYNKTGRIVSPETREKMRQAHLGKKYSEAHRLAISAALAGHKVSEATREKLRNVKVSDETRKKLSRAQSASKGPGWKGGVSRYLYITKDKYRLKKIFGTPLRCFYPGCGKVEGENVKSLDCHHLDGDHTRNPLDGSNWVPLCRSHHMLADGRLKNATAEDSELARKLVVEAHTAFMKHNAVGEVIHYV